MNLDEPLRTIPTPGKRFRRVLQGALLGLGAPIGWAVICLLDGLWSRAEPAYQAWLLLYMGMGTIIAFGTFGYLVGRSEERFAQMSFHDSLTGMLNTRYFHHAFHKEFENAQRYGSPLALLLLDLDHFKRVNDHYGHQTGDAVLVAIARTIGRSIRAGDILARVGGEEFAVIMPGTRSHGARQLGDRIRIAVRDHGVEARRAAAIHVTVSLGVADSDLVEAHTPAELFAAVDEALYRAKRAGRNRVVVARGDSGAEAGYQENIQDGMESRVMTQRPGDLGHGLKAGRP